MYVMCGLLFVVIVEVVCDILAYTSDFLFTVQPWWYFLTLLKHHNYIHINIHTCIHTRTRARVRVRVCVCVCVY